MQIKRQQVELAALALVPADFVKGNMVTEIVNGGRVSGQCRGTFADCLRILDLHEVAPGYGSLFEKTFEHARLDGASGKASQKVAE